MIRLVLNGQEAELTGDETVDLVYTLEDTNNPTIVKNTYSKTINIKGTKANNKIFGDIYRLDREQQFDESYKGIYFDPSRRVPFQLFNDSELITSGYFKLDSIEHSVGHISYTISLYGGLGDFFFNLEYDDAGEKRSLSSLVYNTQGSSKISGNEEDEMSFNVNADTVSRSFVYTPNKDLEGVDPEDIDIWDWITFVPSYNGLYDNFSNDKVLVKVTDGFGNTNAIYSDSKYRSKVDDDKAYSLYNGYAVAELPREMTEWEIRDLRAYKQRPALRIRRAIEAMCDPRNNGGYSVELDGNFFNNDNPYWNDTYITLPMISELVSDIDINREKISYTTSDIKLQSLSAYSTTLLPNAGGDFQYFNLCWQTSNLPYGAKFNMHFTFEMPLYTPQTTKELHISGRSFFKDFKSSIAAQIIAYDQADSIIGYSAILNFVDSDKDFEITPNEWKYAGGNDMFVGNTVNNVYGYFKNGKFCDANADFNTLFELTLQDVPVANNVKFRLCVSRGWNRKGNNVSTFFANTMADAVKYTNYAKVVSTQNAYAIAKYSDYESLNNILVTKDILLNGEVSPADILLSYTKMFGLYYVKDVDRKHIRILTRNNFFTGEIVDIDKCVDYDENLVITPLTYEYKWYSMKLDSHDTKLTDYYKEKYNDKEYGSKRINTAYNFTNEENELFDGNVFKNAITTLDKGNFYYNFKTNNKYYPTINVNYYNWKLFNGVGTDDESSTTFYVYPYNDTSKGDERAIGLSTAYDAFPKICGFDSDNNSVDMSYVLVMRNGLCNCSDSDGNKVYYQVSNDVPEMYLLEDGPCFYMGDLTNNGLSWVDSNAVYLYNLPVYTRYKTNPLIMSDLGYTNDGGIIEHSLDFGMPRETFVGWQYNESTTLYDRYFKAFIEDQYNVNTRKVTCYVKFNGLIRQDCIRKFYLFDNSYWILNEIEDYNPNSDKPVKCEFIKVRSKSNYTNGQKL